MARYAVAVCGKCGGWVDIGPGYDGSPAKRCTCGDAVEREVDRIIKEALDKGNKVEVTT